jgi:hypothetical protein
MRLPGSGVSRFPGNPATWQLFLDGAREWAHGRPWLPRALLLVILALLQLLHIRLFSGITLGFHEMGHLAFAWAPQFITVLMGSVFQVGVPLVVIIIFHRQPDYFGMSIGGIWLAYSLWELSDYVGDARAQDLPLVGFAPSEDLTHDWHYLLGKMHMLPADHALAFVLKALSLGAAGAALAFAGWLLIRMAKD